MRQNKKILAIPLPSIPKRFSMQQVLIVLLVISSFLIGVLYTKVQYLEKNGGSPTQAAAPQAVAPQQAPPEDTSPKKVSVDDDPILGDKNAKVTLIDFSDYECPFCKRYFDETYSQIKKDYVDTGKVKIVFRDLPLPFHEPMATTEAVAANCARIQGDDTTYFKYHDEIFKRTKSNGNGLTKDDLYKISDDLRLNTATLKTCIDDKKQEDEVRKDLADANAAGASGTPTFFIGKSTSDGIIDGTKLIGAQPFSAFKTIIDQQLK